MLPIKPVGVVVAHNHPVGSAVFRRTPARGWGALSREQAEWTYSERALFVERELSQRVGTGSVSDSWGGSESHDAGARQFRPRTVCGDAADRVGEGGPGGLAAELVAVERGAQSEQSRAALAAGQLKGGADVGSAGVWVGVGVGAQPQHFGVVEVSGPRNGTAPY